MGGLEVDIFSCLRKVMSGAKFCYIRKESNYVEGRNRRGERGELKDNLTAAMPQGEESLKKVLLSYMQFHSFCFSSKFYDKDLLISKYFELCFVFGVFSFNFFFSTYLLKYV